MPKLKEQYFHRLNRATAYSLGLIIPKAYADKLGLTETATMEITVNKNGSLTLKPVNLPEDFSFNFAAES